MTPAPPAHPRQRRREANVLTGAWYQRKADREIFQLRQILLAGDVPVAVLAPDFGDDIRVTFPDLADDWKQIGC